MSALGRHIRKLADREGLGSCLFTASFSLYDPAATDTMQYVLPVDAMLVAASASVTNPGTTGAATQIAIDNTTQTTTDLDGGELDIAFDDTPVQADRVSSSDILNGMTPLEGNVGDVYLITIDAVDTDGAVADLNINLTFVTL